MDALIDLPYALLTAVSGIARTTLYARTGWIGQDLEPLGADTCWNPGAARRCSDANAP